MTDGVDDQQVISQMRGLWGRTEQPLIQIGRIILAPNHKWPDPLRRTWYQNNMDYNVLLIVNINSWIGRMAVRVLDAFLEIYACLWLCTWGFVCRWSQVAPNLSRIQCARRSPTA